MSSVETKQLVFFDLETSGLEKTADVLQIGLKYGCSKFNVYMKPKCPIDPQASAVNNLTFRDGELYYKNTKKLRTVSQHVALISLLDYLKDFQRPCVLVAHNCRFDRSFLLRMIEEENLEDEFDDVVAGFTDTLAMLKQKFPDKKSKGQLTLKTLANELSLSSEGAHDAQYDAYLLEKIALYHFTNDQLVAASKRIRFRPSVPL